MSDHEDLIRRLQIQAETAHPAHAETRIEWIAAQALEDADRENAALRERIQQLDAEVQRRNRTIENQAVQIADARAALVSKGLKALDALAALGKAHGILSDPDVEDRVRAHDERVAERVIDWIDQYQATRANPDRALPDAREHFRAEGADR